MNSDMSPKGLMNLLASVGDKPLLVDSSHSQAFFEAFATAMVDPDRAGSQKQHLSNVASAYAEAQDGSGDKPFIFSQGYAVIPIHGALLNRHAFASADATGYNFIRSQLNAAMADDDVQAVIYDIASTGGHAAGCFEMATDMFEASKTKPSVALVDPYALSAGQALAAAATETYLTPSSYAGSIGVLTSHVDVSGLLEKHGVSMELLYEGARKVDGNPFGPLTDEARASAKGRLSALYSRFVGHVAEMRNISEDSVRGTEAAIFSAEEAQTRGLIDGIASPQAALAQFQSNRLQNRNISMDPQHQQQAPAPAPAQQQQQQQNAPAPTQQQNAPAPQQDAPAPAPQQDAASGERARVKAILNSEEGAANPNLANHLAFETDASPDQAVAMLKAAGPSASSPTANGDPLGNLMDGSGGGPNVPLASSKGGDAEEDAAGSSAILSAMGHAAPGAEKTQH